MTPTPGVPRPLLDGMTRVLAHRGPDGYGYLIKGHIGFGHSRLSIIDLAGGDQPIYNEDGRIAVVFNGEIYNYVELMDELIARGHRFKTRADTEVIVHLYEEFGRRCTDHLRGMFAFAIWDGRDHSVLLARDRLGIKPLFYRLDRDCLLFASELKSIVQDVSVPRRLNLDALGRVSGVRLHSGRPVHSRWGLEARPRPYPHLAQRANRDSPLLGCRVRWRPVAEPWTRGRRSWITNSARRRDCTFGPMSPSVSFSAAASIHRPWWHWPRWRRTHRSRRSPSDSPRRTTASSNRPA